MQLLEPASECDTLLRKLGCECRALPASRANTVNFRQRLKRRRTTKSLVDSAEIRCSWVKKYAKDMKKLGKTRWLSINIITHSEVAIRKSLNPPQPKHMLLLTVCCAIFVNIFRIEPQWLESIPKEPFLSFLM